MNLGFLDSQIAPLPSHYGRNDYLLNKHTREYYERGRIESRTNDRTNDLQVSSGGHQQRQKPLTNCFKPTFPETSNEGTPNSVTMYPSLKQHQQDKMSSGSNTRKRPSSAYSFPPLPTSTTSKAIPIAGDSMKRTASELQLMEDEAMADYRDYCMYTRIVKGMNERRSWTKLPCYDDEATRAIHSITRTRQLPVKDSPTSYVTDGCLRRHSTGVTEPLILVGAPHDVKFAQVGGETTRTPATQVRELQDKDGRRYLPDPRFAGPGALFVGSNHTHPQHFATMESTGWNTTATTQIYGQEGDDGVFMMDDM